MLTSCGSFSSRVPVDLPREFAKICVMGSGKGRIELLKDKYTFTYESQLSAAKNKFDLSLDFPVVGERQIALSLDPAVVNETIKKSEITAFLKEQLKDVPEKARVGKALEEFFVFASEFMRARAFNQWPKHYKVKFVNEHFILERETPSYLFVVDNFSANEIYYERSVFKISIKNLFSDPILTLFLVPESCEK